MTRRASQLCLHAALLALAVPTLLPFVFALNNSLRTTTEMYHGYFGMPRALVAMLHHGWQALAGNEQPVRIITAEHKTVTLTQAGACRWHGRAMSKNYGQAWTLLRPYLLNTLYVVLCVALGVLLTGSITAFILARFAFPGKRVIFYYFICTMMFPGVLTLVPSFLLVKRLGLLNSYGALIWPMIAGGQVFAIFVFKSFFDGLPQDLLDSAKIDGAGFFGLYRHIVLPLSQPVIAVVMIMNILGTWNSFLWPFIVNTDARYHIIASGLYVMSVSESANNMGVLFAAYVLASIPLLLLFAFATKPFMQGMTSGAFKA
jgi:ABC-type glycerol-3-phosphate transport system permease component